jgi:hypothetical protein
MLRSGADSDASLSQKNIFMSGMIKVFEIISSNAACADFDAFCVRASGARLVDRALVGLLSTSTKAKFETLNSQRMTGAC